MHIMFNWLAHRLPLKHRIKARIAQLRCMKIKRLIKLLLLPPIVLPARGE
jgi:prepilin signal peptidase PulO-like enzyme (type II secretory pathway)